jgi:hypothetical protein
VCIALRLFLTQKMSKSRYVIVTSDRYQLQDPSILKTQQINSLGEYYNERSRKPQKRIDFYFNCY